MGVYFGEFDTVVATQLASDWSTVFTQRVLYDILPQDYLAFKDSVVIQVTETDGWSPDDVHTFVITGLENTVSSGPVNGPHKTVFDTNYTLGYSRSRARTF